MKTRRILILGGNRFFGKILAENLLREGHFVTLLNRGQTPDGLGDEFGARLQRIRLNRKTLHRDHTFFKNSDGTSKNWDIVYDQVCYDAAEAAQACAAFEGRTLKYVFTSSQSVYGRGRALKECDFNPYAYLYEKPVSMEENYAEGKRQAETTFFKHAKFPVVAVRFPIVLGTQDYTKRLQFHVERIKNGKPLFFPDLSARISFVLDQDAALFLKKLLLFKPEESLGAFSGPINCCATDPISLGDLMAEIGRVANTKPLLVNQPLESERSPFELPQDWFMDTSQMNAMGFQARSISEFLPQLILDLLRSSGPI